MKRIELTKTFMMISNLKNPLVSMVYTNISQRLKGQYTVMNNYTLATRVNYIDPTANYMALLYNLVNYYKSHYSYVR